MLFILKLQCFSRFLNCTEGTKSCKASHILPILQPISNVPFTSKLSNTVLQRTFQNVENSSVNKAKGRISKGVFQEKKHGKFSEKKNMSKCSFFEKFVVLSFLEPPVLRFALLPYYQRIVEIEWNIGSKCVIPLSILLPQY